MLYVGHYVSGINSCQWIQVGHFICRDITLYFAGYKVITCDTACRITGGGTGLQDGKAILLHINLRQLDVVTL